MDAVIVQDLCSPVILGLPFYLVNKLLIDPANRTLLCRNGRDLLRPLDRLKQDVRTERQRRLDKRKAVHDENVMAQENIVLENMMRETQHKDVVRELNLRFGISRSPPAPAPIELEDNMVATIQQRIDVLAMLDILAKENDQMRTRFADIFPDDIPHINELPTDVYHRFRLKDPNTVIARRQYKCPKKYREAWKVLLQQHLNAGRIRPSSSPHASPAFLFSNSEE